MTTTVETLWQSVLKTALLGAKRQQEGFRTDGSLGEVLAQIYPQGALPNAETRDQALLNASALITLYRQCGQGAAPAKMPAPPPCPPETTPAISKRSVHHLKTILSDSILHTVLPEWLAAAAGRHVPPDVLPALLDAGRRETRLHPLILEVIGARGHWLASFNPDWKYAALQQRDDEASKEDPERVMWDEGSHALRIRYLKQLRARDAEAARSLIEEDWESERAKERVDFLETLSEGLSLSDELFLERCLEDRSKLVREEAAGLLAALPTSGLSQRMQERTADVLSFKTKKKSRHRGKKLALRVALPDALDPAWQRDGIVEKAPSGHGKKGWWLEQLAAALPPSWWTETSGGTPEEVIVAIRATDWDKVLLAALLRATLRHRDTAWALPLMRHAKAEPAALWPLVPLEEQEVFLQHMLKQPSVFSQSNTAYSDVNGFGPPWSEGFTRLLAADIARHPDKMVYYYLSHFSDCMAPTMLDEIEHLWRNERKEGATHAAAFERALDKIRFRRDMLAELAT